MAGRRRTAFKLPDPFHQMSRRSPGLWAAGDTGQATARLDTSVATIEEMTNLAPGVERALRYTIEKRPSKRCEIFAVLAWYDREHCSGKLLLVPANGSTATAIVPIPTDVAPSKSRITVIGRVTDQLSPIHQSLTPIGNNLGQLLLDSFNCATDEDSRVGWRTWARNANPTQSTDAGVQRQLEKIAALHLDRDRFPDYPPGTLTPPERCTRTLADILACRNDDPSYPALATHIHECNRCMSLDDARTKIPLLKAVGHLKPCVWSAGYFPCDLNERWRTVLLHDEAGPEMGTGASTDQLILRVTRPSAESTELYAVVVWDLEQPANAATFSGDLAFLLFPPGMPTHVWVVGGAEKLQRHGLSIVGLVGHDELHGFDVPSCEALLHSYQREMSEDIRRAWREWATSALNRSDLKPVVRNALESIQSDEGVRSTEARQPSVPTKIVELESSGSDQLPAEHGPDIRTVLRSIATDDAAVRDDQRRLSSFIRLENLRLSRLIINLYLKFSLSPEPDEDVYYSVCHSIAEYFHADCCQLMLVHRQRDLASSDDEPNAFTKHLQLYGAFGAWERALKSLFVRRRIPIRYEVPDLSRLDANSPDLGLGNTRYLWILLEPKALAHRGQWGRSGYDPLKSSELESIPHQMAWPNFGLSTTGRNILGGSMRRLRLAKDPASSIKEQYALGDGLIKVENKRPRRLDAFCSGGDKDLLFGNLWVVTAIRPFVRYLLRKPSPHESLHNEVGWERRYAELSKDVQLFRDMRDWYGRTNDAEKCSLELKQLKTALGYLVDFATNAESYVQHLRHGIRVLLSSPACNQSDGQDKNKDLGTTNVASFFNIENICNAWKRIEMTDGKLVDRHRRELQTIFKDFACIANSTPDGIDNAVGAAVRGILEHLGWDESKAKLSRLLEGSLCSGDCRKQLDYVAACKFVLRDLDNLASQLLRGFPSEGTSNIGHLALRQEYRRLYRWSKRVLAITRKRLALIAEGEPTASDVNRALGLLAEAVALAGMNSHTFGDADEARMLFISRRVTQLLDNRIISLAQARGIEVSHDEIAKLQLDDFALENLERIRTDAEAIGSHLQRAMTWWAGQYSEKESLPSCEIGEPDLRLLMSRAKEFAASESRTEQTSEVRLLWTIARMPDNKQLANADELIARLCRPDKSPWGIWLQEKRRGANEEHIGFDLWLKLETTTASYDESDWLLVVANNVTKLRSQLNAWLTAAERGELKKLEPCCTTRRPDLRQATALHDIPATVRPSRLRNLREKLDALITYAGDQVDGDDLFSSLEDTRNKPGPLSELCESIAEVIGTDSCAIFFTPAPLKAFATEGSANDGTMRMRGASGNLRYTLNAWYAASPTERVNINGVEYKSCWNDDLARQSDLTRKQLESIMRGEIPARSHEAAQRWSLTNQIWHLGEGRVASSRLEFRIAALRRLEDRGRGDKYAYPPDGDRDAPHWKWTLRNVFRNSVGIPIFTRGGQTDYIPQRTDDWWVGAETDATRPEFHRAYRVIGILKLEGKQPRQEVLNEADDWWGTLTEFAQSKIAQVLADAPGNVRYKLGTSLHDQAKSLLLNLYTAESDPTGLGWALLSNEDGSIDERFVDELTEIFDARWEPEDIELLVSIAMELGRLLTLQTLRRATRDGIVIGENDVGLLDIRPRDIEGIRLCNLAADRVAAKVEHALQSVQVALLDEQRRGTRSGRIAEPEIHKPIVSVDRRRKDLVSLFRKCIQKELTYLRSDSTTSTGSSARTVNLAPGCVLEVRDWNNLSSPERIIQGRATLKVWRDGAGTQILETDLRYGGNRLRSSPSAESLTTQAGLSFCQRVLHRDRYGIDDWAAVRVVCHFLSDVDVLIDAIQATFPQCGIELNAEDVERWLDFAQADGYRGIHMTVYVSLLHLLSKEQHDNMLHLLDSNPGVVPHLVRPVAGGGRSVWFPCEIQIRTAYQHSWSRATHPLMYKRKDVPDDLRGHMQALSGMLFESDKIVDLIRRRIEAENSHYVELLEYLRGRLPHDGFALVHFGAEFASEFHRENLQYGGEPLFGYLLDTADCLVRSLGIEDPFMVLLAFFHNLWMDDAGARLAALAEQRIDLESPIPTQIPYPNVVLAEVERKITAFKQIVAKGHRAFVFQRLQSRLPAMWPTHARSENSYAFGEVPHWFKELLVLYIRAWHPIHKGTRMTRLQLLSERVDFVKNVATRRDETLLTALAEDLERRGCVIETAIQLSRLSELPNDPHRRRAIRDFEEIYQILEQIRRRIGDDLRPVLRRAEISLRMTADKLGTHLPIDWES